MERSVEVKPANDLPYYENGLPPGGVAGNVNVPGHSVDIPVENIIPVKDVDSPTSSITYTLQAGSYKGKLYYKNDDGTYREIDVGSSFTQADLDNGKIVYVYYGGFGKEYPDAPADERYVHIGVDSFRFTVRDSGICVLDPDGYPVDKAYEGGIGEWVDYTETGGNEVDGVWVGAERTGGKFVATDIFINFNVDYKHGSGTWTPPTRPVVGEGEVMLGGDAEGTVFEGGDLYLTKDDLHAFMRHPVTEDGKPDSTMDKDDPGITYRLTAEGEYGSLWVLEYEVNDDGTTKLDEHGKAVFTGRMREVLVGCSFTQQDVEAGAVFYRHNGAEVFADSFSFTISDGTVEYKAGASEGPTEVIFGISVIPLNDQPVVGGEITVKEGPTKDQRDAEEHGFDDLGVALTKDSLGLKDVDGSKGSPGLTHGGVDYAANNGLTFVVIEKPKYGDIWIYTGSTAPGSIDGYEKITYASEADAKGNTTWNITTLNGATIITMADLEAGRVRYIHDGSENFHDDIRIIANDNKGVGYNPGFVQDGETFPAGSYVKDDIIPGYWDNGTWIEEQVVGADGLVLVSDLLVGGTWVNGSSEVETDAPANNNGHTIYGPNQSSISDVGTIKVNITPVNDKVIFDKNTGITVSFGEEAVTSVEQFVTNGGNLDDIRITKDMLSWTDDDAFTADEQFDPAQVMYIIQEPPANGSLYVQNSKGEWICSLHHFQIEIK